MHGILVVDKPGGLTSHDVVRRIRRLLGVRRVGHTGTLDPLATGVLPVAVGEGTRLVQFLIEGDKCYRARLRLGLTTDTQDIEGEILERRPWAGVSEAGIRREVAALTGPIRQVPPMYSALKKNGIPLHRLARQGIEVEREARPVTIHRFEILEAALPDLEVLVACSKGTYVRTLVHDLGERLGCGATLTALRRTVSGPFAEADCVTLEELEGADRPAPRLLGPREALPHLAVVEVDAAAFRRLRNGIPPAAAECCGLDRCAAGDQVLLAARGAIQGVARFEPGREQEKRGDFVLLRVFSRPDIW